MVSRKPAAAEPQISTAEMVATSSKPAAAAPQIATAESATAEIVASEQRKDEPEPVAKRRRLRGKAQPTPQPTQDPLELLRLAGFTENECNRWKVFKFPPEVVYLVLAIKNSDKAPANCKLIEYFAGIEALVNRWTIAGHDALAFDKYSNQSAEDIAKFGVGDRHQDMCAPEGLVTALYYYFRGDTDALQWFATVCSTWIFMSRFTTGRSESVPMGNTTFGMVACANNMTARTGIVIALCYVQLKAWCLEQPDKSLMKCHTTLAFIKAVCDIIAPFPAGPLAFDWIEVVTHMGHFGAERPKKTELISNCNFIRQLQRLTPGPPGRVFPSMTESGIAFIRTDKRVTGKSDLKNTQAYTDDFADHVFEAWNGVWHGGDNSDRDVRVPLEHVLNRVNDNFAREAWAIAEVGEALQLFRAPV